MKRLTIFLILTLFSIFSFAGFQAYQSTTNLGVMNIIKCSTGLTCTKVGDKLNIVSSPSLVGPLALELGVMTISNPTSYDMTVISSGDSSITLKGYEAKAATLNLYADEGDDNGDKFSVQVSTDSTLAIQANGTAGLKMSASGDVTLYKSFIVPIASFTSGDTTPSIANGVAFRTATGNTVTITAFDDAVSGQEFTVISGGAATFDVTSSSIECGSTDLVTASGDVTVFIYDGAKSRCKSFMDLSDNLN